MSADIITNDPRWDNIDIELNPILESIQHHLTLENSTDFSLLLTNDSEIQTFNKDYRGQDKPTNVLSFPCDTGSEEMKNYIGDILLSFDTLEKECTEQKKTFQDHTTHMIIHGILHLFGYDHIQKEDADAMEALEIQILSSLNIKNPYDA